MRRHRGAMLAALTLALGLTACENSEGGATADSVGNNPDAGTIADKDAAAASQDSGGAVPATDAGATTTPSDTAGSVPVADAGTSAPECSDKKTCGIGAFCKAGVCCPALGCNPQCPNGVQLDAKGCETCTCATSSPKACNPLSMGPAALCAAGEYCALPQGQCGSSKGQCTAKPASCSMQLAPVCGCDGQTYSNACLCAAEGVTVAAVGACKPALGLRFFKSCGDPVCSSEWKPTAGVPLCESQKEGDDCAVEGEKCDPKAGCGQLLICAKSDPKASGCPISKAKYKRDVQYVDSAQRQKLAAELLDTRLATYRYTAAGPEGRRHLGFIIDDQPGGTAVDARRDMVDLYGYLSLSVATLQEQQRQIETLQRKLEQLEARCAQAAAVCR